MKILPSGPIGFTPHNNGELLFFILFIFFYLNNSSTKTDLAYNLNFPLKLKKLFSNFFVLSFYVVFNFAPICFCFDILFKTQFLINFLMLKLELSFMVCEFNDSFIQFSI